MFRLRTVVRLGVLGMLLAAGVGLVVVERASGLAWGMIVTALALAAAYGPSRRAAADDALSRKAPRKPS